MGSRKVVPGTRHHPLGALLVLSLGAGLLAACQVPPEMQAMAEKFTGQPPSEEEAAAANTNLEACRRIAVLPFEGDQGGVMAARAETAVARVGRYTLVDRQRIDQVLNEIGFQSTAVTDPATASRVGRLAGADCIMTGVVNLDKVQRGRYTDEQCEAGPVNLPGWMGKLTGACEKYEVRRTSCESVDANFVMVPRVVQVETGSVVFVETISGEAQTRNCNGPAAATESQVQEDARGDAFAQLTQRMTPAAGGTTVAATTGSSGGGCARVPNGPRVREVQQKLAALDYPVGTPDGLYGQATANGLSAFRGDRGLSGGGSFTECNASQVTAALDEALESRAPAAGPESGPDVQLTSDSGAPSPAPSPPPDTGSGFEDLGLD